MGPEIRKWEDGPKPLEKDDDKKPKKEAADGMDDKDVLAKNRKKAESNMMKGKEEKKKMEKELQDAYDEDVCPDCKKKAAKEEAPEDDDAPKKEGRKEEKKEGKKEEKKEEKKDFEMPSPAEPKIEEVKVKEEVVGSGPPDMAASGPPALAQKDDNTNLPDPERVHILEPRVYQERANTNTPNTRTTFYAKKNPSNLVI